MWIPIRSAQPSRKHNEGRPAPVPADVITSTGVTEQVYTYWVAQRKISADPDKAVMSRFVPIYDTVYARPVIAVSEPKAVCAPNTIDLASHEIWSYAQTEGYARAYLDEGSRCAKVIWLR